VVFKGNILGGAHQFWGNPYLNSTTILFDKIYDIDLMLLQLNLPQYVQYMHHGLIFSSLKLIVSHFLTDSASQNTDGQDAFPAFVAVILYV